MEEQVLKNKQDIAYHYEVDRTLANFGIKVVGVVANVSELPIPYIGDYGDAYAVGNPGDYTYYIWTRANPDLGYTVDFWLDAGKLAIDTDLGTIVTVDGEKQVTWNADTKLDKITDPGGYVRLYGVVPDGRQHGYILGTTPGAMSTTNIPQYFDPAKNLEDIQPSGSLFSHDPQTKYQVATKNYVDTNTANKNSTSIGAGTMQKIFGMKSDGTVGWYYAAGAAGMGFYTYFTPCYMPINHVPTASHEAQLDGSVLFTGSPIHPYQCANKKYVDDAVKLYKTVINLESTEGAQYTIYCNTHRNLTTSWSTLEELNEQYEGNLNFMLYEHIANNEGYISFIFAVENAIENDGILTIAAKVGTTGLNVITFDKDSAIMITSTPTS